MGRLVFLFIIAAAVVLPLRAWVGEPIVIASGSMSPTLRVGAPMFLDKWTLLWREPRRGEIISFRSPVGDEDMVKRVIAIPGDTVELREKVVILNGKALQEDYTSYIRRREHLAGDDMAPLTVPSRAYFVLGDDRDESFDSASWKDSSGDRVYFLPRRRVQGVVRRLPWLL